MVPPRVSPKSADLDLARLRLLGLRNRHGQDSATVLGLDLLTVDLARQGEAASEATVGALDAPELVLALLALELALASPRRSSRRSVEAALTSQKGLKNPKRTEKTIRS